VTYNAVAPAHSRKSFYAVGRFWVFWIDEPNVVFSSSLDGSSWETPTILRECSDPYCFNLFFDGTYVHYAVIVGTNIYYRRGLPKSDGTIAWDDEQLAYASTERLSEVTITVDSNGYPWIGWFNDGQWVTKSSRNDGIWETAPGFPHEFVGIFNDYVDYPLPIPLTNGKVYVILTGGMVSPPYTPLYGQLWNGTEWEQVELITDNIDLRSVNAVSAVNIGDDIYVAFTGWTPNRYLYGRKRTYGSGWGGIETIQEEDVVPVLSVDPSSGTIYCFWLKEDNHIYYKKRVNGIWDTEPTDWIDESIETLTGYDYDYFSGFYQAYGNYIGLTYMTKAESPYNVKFAFLTVIVAVAETIVAKNFPMDYLPSPVKAEQLTSKVSGATIIKVSQDYPLTLLKKGKAEELRSKWT
jgi:hypothetical protein